MCVYVCAELSGSLGGQHTKLPVMHHTACSLLAEALEAVDACVQLETTEQQPSKGASDQQQVCVDARSSLLGPLFICSRLFGFVSHSTVLACRWGSSVHRRIPYCICIVVCPCMCRLRSGALRFTRPSWRPSTRWTAYWHACGLSSLVDLDSRI